MRVSILQGHVRVAMASNWDDARRLLKAHVTAVHASLPRTERSEELYTDEMLRCDLPVTGTCLITSGPQAWANTRRFAIEGIYGVAEGDLCYVHEYSNRCSWWTVDVKCKVLSVTATQVIVRVTGESIQFDRGEVRSLPLGFITRRK